jgi:hypothetical protein
MMTCMMRQEISLTHTQIGQSEPNRRQELALGRIERAVGELATVLLSSSVSNDVSRAAVRDVRKAVAPVLADVLSAD